MGRAAPDIRSVCLHGSRWLTSCGGLHDAWNVPERRESCYLAWMLQQNEAADEMELLMVSVWWSRA